MKYTFVICVKRFWIVKRYFLLKKHAFNGVLKVIDIQKNFYINIYDFNS